MSFSNYGRWKKSIQVVSGSGIFSATGSNDGVEAILIGNNPSGIISLYNGGSITIENLIPGTVYEFSPKFIVVTGGDHVQLLYSKKI